MVWVLFIVTLIAFVNLWYLSVDSGYLNETYVSSPEAIYVNLQELYMSGMLFEHLWASTARIVPGLVIGTLIGFPYACFVLLFPWLKSVWALVLAIMYAFSKLSVFYLFVIMMGIGDEPKIAIVAYITFLFTTALPLFAGDSLLYPRYRSDDTATEMLEVIAIIGPNRWQLFRDFLVPMLMPHMVRGLMLSSGLCWTLLLVTEGEATTRGVGYYTLLGWDNMSTSQLMAGTLLLAVCNFAVWGVIKGVERLLTRR